MLILLARIHKVRGPATHIHSVRMASRYVEAIILNWIAPSELLWWWLVCNVHATHRPLRCDSRLYILIINNRFANDTRALRYIDVCLLDLFHFVIVWRMCDWRPSQRLSQCRRTGTYTENAQWRHFPQAVMCWIDLRSNFDAAADK